MQYEYRSFEIDVLTCPKCQGKMKILAVIKDPAEAARLCESLGEPAQPPTVAPSRLHKQQQWDFDPQVDVDSQRICRRVQPWRNAVVCLISDLIGIISEDYPPITRTTSTLNWSDLSWVLLGGQKSSFLWPILHE